MAGTVATLDAPGNTGWGIVAGVALALGATAAVMIPARTPAPLPPTSEAPVLTVGGWTVPAREFLQFLDTERANTISHFQRDFGARVDSGFWTTKYGNETPRDFLIVRAQEDAVRATVELQQAQKLQLTDGFTYSAFLAQWQSENLQRAKASASNQVIYGPRQYSEANYFQHVLDEVGQALEAKLLSSGVLVVSQTVMQQYYNAHSSELAAVAGGGGTNAKALGPPAPPSFAAVSAQVQRACEDAAFEDWLAQQVTRTRVGTHPSVLERLAVS